MDDYIYDGGQAYERVSCCATRAVPNCQASSRAKVGLQDHQSRRGRGWRLTCTNLLRQRYEIMPPPILRPDQHRSVTRADSSAGGRLLTRARAP